MNRLPLATLAMALATLPTAVFAADTVLEGSDAFGDWQQSQPGVWRHITPGDLPEPYATQSASNAPGLISRPDSAMPQVPAGFKVELVKDGFSGPRDMAVAPNGDLFVVDSAAEEVRVLRLREGTAEVAEDAVFASEGLDRPYGVAFYPLDDPEWVYVGNAGGVVRFPYESGAMEAAGPAETVVADIPSGGHWTRDIAFSPDGGTLYVAVGSASNIGRGQPPASVVDWAASHALGEMWGAEEGRAAVIAFDPDGGNRRVFATGIRNCSGLTVEPTSGTPWCVTNERDGLGDNLPPDYATSVAEGGFYGWPWYYIGANEAPRLAGQRPDLADKVSVPDVLFQAHSAPLNIAFYDGDLFPAEYAGDAFVTMHGSWNRGRRTGYKLVRLKFEDGKPTGAYQDFMTGFVQSADRVWGRPVGVTVLQDGSLVVSEDGNGTIWRISPS